MLLVQTVDPSAAITPQVSRRPFVDVLWDLHQVQETGFLEVSDGEVETVIHLRAGVPVSVGAGFDGNNVGRVLLHQQVIDEEQYREIVEMAADCQMGDEPMAFRDAAIAFGMLTPEQIDAALGAQLRQRVMHCVAYEQPTCQFSRDEGAPTGESSDPGGVERLILDGVRHHYGAARADRELAAVKPFFVALTTDPGDIASAFALGAEEQQFLAGLDGASRLAKVLFNAPIAVTTAQQLIVALRAMGHIEFRVQAWQPARLPAGAFGPGRATVRTKSAPVMAQRAVSSDAREPRSSGVRQLRPAAKLTPVAITTQPFAPTSAPPAARPATVAPPSVPPRPRASTAPTRPAMPAASSRPPPPAQARMPRPRAATIVPPAASRRTEPAAMLAQRAEATARHAFREGRRRLQAFQPEQAIELLQRAHELKPTVVEYELHLLWAQLCATSDRVVAHKLENELRTLARNAMRLDKRLAFAHYIRGQLAMRKGDYPRATKSFGFAAKLDPADLDAKRHLLICSRRAKS